MAPHVDRLVPVSDIRTIRSRYRRGETLQAIADSYGVSREYIRRLSGLKAIDGGASVGRAASKIVTRLKRIAAKKKRVAANEIAACERHSISLTHWRAIKKARALRAFHAQRGTAKQRGIKWCLSLSQWWELWRTSGKWSQRGVGVGRYCMARNKDAGHYAVGNVSIILSTKNSSDGNRIKFKRRSDGD